MSADKKGEHPPALTFVHYEPNKKILQANPVDVVITDFSLPVMDGVAVAAEVRESHPGIPLVLLSGWGGDKADMNADMFDFPMAKPCRLDVLADTMEQALARGAGTA